MNNQHLAEAINKLLTGLSKPEIKQVLTQVFHDQQCFGYEQNTSQPIYSANVYRRGRLSKISKDPEMESFINSLPYMEQKEILALIIEKFGEARAPSRSGLSCYFKAKREKV